MPNSLARPARSSPPLSASDWRRGAATRRSRILVSADLYRATLHPYTQALLSAVPVPERCGDDHEAACHLYDEAVAPADAPAGV